MKKYTILLIWFIVIQINAQDLMRVTTQDGTQYELSVNNIKDMDFYIPEQINFVGEWIVISGSTMVCYDIKNDGTMKRTSFSMNVGQMYEINGTYSIKDNVLTLNFDGSTLVIPVVEATETKIVSTSGDTYFRVQADVYSMTTTDNPISIGKEGDVVKYVDNCIVGTDNNKITALRDGRGYAIVEDAETKGLKAYCINVTGTEGDIIIFNNYFKKSRDVIVEGWGNPNQINEEKHTMTYTNFTVSIQYVTFSFNDNWSEVTKVQVSFYDEGKRQKYVDYIEKYYVFNRATSSGKIYYDTEDPNSATVQITIYDASVMCTIVYSDLNTTPASVIDWTTYFKKSAEHIEAEFGKSTDITNDDEYEDYSMVYYNVSDDIKYITLSFNKGFEKVKSVRVSYKNANSMQGYREAIAEQYILYSETETRKTYYDTDSPSTASVRIIINSSGTSNYISYLDMSE